MGAGWEASGSIDHFDASRQEFDWCLDDPAGILPA
jgi:hypothetical protein